MNIEDIRTALFTAFGLRAYEERAREQIESLEAVKEAALAVEERSNTVANVIKATDDIAGVATNA